MPTDLESLRRDVEALDDPKLREEALRELEVLERLQRETPKPPVRVGFWTRLRRLFSRPVGASFAEEVDPLAEAEVYVSYGRISQAVEILEKAHAAQPGRQDILQRLRALRLRVR